MQQRTENIILLDSFFCSVLLRYFFTSRISKVLTSTVLFLSRTIAIVCHVSLPSENFIMAEYKQTMETRRYQIREKIFSIGHNFTIKDESGHPVYTVRSKVFSIGHNLILEDMDGKYVNLIH